MEWVSVRIPHEVQKEKEVPFSQEIKHVFFYACLLSTCGGLVLFGYLETNWSTYFMIDIAASQEEKEAQISFKPCLQDWSDPIYETSDGIYNLSFCVNVKRPPNRSITALIRADLVTNDKSKTYLSFDDLANLNDYAWKSGFDDKVYKLYPQFLNTRDAVKKVKKGDFIHVVPINNPTLTFLKVSSSICPPLSKNKTVPTSLYDLIVIVKSAVYNFDNRKKYRQAYSKLNRNLTYDSFRFAIVYSIGLPRKKLGNFFRRDGFNISLNDRAGDSLPKSLKEQQRVADLFAEERRKHDDLLIGEYEDTYFNLTLKMMYTFQWATRFCKGKTPVFLLIDDDFAFQVSALQQLIKRYAKPDWPSIIEGENRCTGSAMRNYSQLLYRKWSVSKKEIPWPRHVCHAPGAYLIAGSRIMEDLSIAMFFTASVPIDDVWLGIVMNKLDLSFIYSGGFYPNLSWTRWVKNIVIAPFEQLLKGNAIWTNNQFFS